MFSSVSALLLVTQPVPATPAPPAASSTAVQPVDPQRLALARTTMERIFPQGSYGRMMTEMMGNSMGAAMGGMLDMTPEQMGVPETEKNKAERRTTMREQILKDDPHFEERMRITTKIMGEEMGRVGTLMEPAMRQGLTHALARRFSTAQLTDINSFLATSSGQAFGHQFILVWTDP